MFLIYFSMVTTAPRVLAPSRSSQPVAPAVSSARCALPRSRRAVLVVAARDRGDGRGRAHGSGGAKAAALLVDHALFASPRASRARPLDSPLAIMPPLADGLAVPRRVPLVSSHRVIAETCVRRSPAVERAEDVDAAALVLVALCARWKGVGSAEVPDLAVPAVALAPHAVDMAPGTLGALVDFPTVAPVARQAGRLPRHRRVAHVSHASELQVQQPGNRIVAVADSRGEAASLRAVNAAISALDLLGLGGARRAGVPGGAQTVTSPVRVVRAAPVVPTEALEPLAVDAKVPRRALDLVAFRSVRDFLVAVGADLDSDGSVRAFGTVESRGKGSVGDGGAALKLLAANTARGTEIASGAEAGASGGRLSDVGAVGTLTEGGNGEKRERERRGEKEEDEEVRKKNKQEKKKRRKEERKKGRKVRKGKNKRSTETEKETETDRNKRNGKTEKQRVSSSRVSKRSDSVESTPKKRRRFIDEERDSPGGIGNEHLRRNSVPSGTPLARV